MPIYEYKCQKCGAKFEIRRSINENDKDIKCPKCETESPRRVFSAFTTGCGAGSDSSTATSSCSPTGFS
jgi:putative FmdB family regulatory protein